MEFYTQLSREEYQKLMRRKRVIELDRSRIQYFQALYNFEQNTEAPEMKQKLETNG